MIFVLSDDNILYVLDSESELHGAFEGIDVEEGRYKFFDEAGAPLKAEFVTPNQKGKTFGIFEWVISGHYHLVSTEAADLPWLSDVLCFAAGLEQNSHFDSLQAVQLFLTTRPTNSPASKPTAAL